MAALQLRSGAYRVLFRYLGQQHQLSIGEVPESEALLWKARVEFLLTRLKQRLVEVPPGCTIVQFIQYDGKPPADLTTDVRKDTTFSELRDSYVTTFSNGAIEANTLYTAKIHLNHVETTLGGRFLLNGLSMASLQKHIERRQADVLPVTIRKEINSFRATWNWGERMKLVQGGFPSRGLVYPKIDEKPPYMTFQEIERRIKAGGDPDTLWETLYLDADQITRLLEHVKATAWNEWVNPMFVMAAHTGARRSELLRVQSADVDLAGRVVTFREKKRSRGTRTTRRVPISDLLAKALKSLMRQNRLYLFGDGIEPLTGDAAHQAFERAVKGSKWDKKMKGWHVLRHSFISVLASAGTDQRIIDEFAGHSTEQQRRRYRHLLPNVTQQAIQAAFG
ncbi:MAG TPA: tyrosine-type recombinase/integrase [Pirellulales bacterium]|jgi:integrase